MDKDALGLRGRLNELDAMEAWSDAAREAAEEARKSKGITTPPMPQHEYLNPESNPGMPKLWSHLQEAQTPAEARKIGKQYEDASLHPKGHPERLSDGAREMLIKARQEHLRAQNTSQTSAADARTRAVLQIRDSSGRATGRKMT